MRYQETREASAELLRLIIPEIARHDLSYNPINYAIFYETLADINPALRKALDEAMAQGQPLNGERIDSLFQQYIGGRNDALDSRFHDELKRLFDELAGLTQDIAGRAGKYGDRLELCQHEITGEMDPVVLGRRIETLLNETRAIRSSMSEMQKQLRDQAAEVETLRRSLAQALGEAMTDPLTGLLNRRGFDQTLAYTLAKAAEPADQTLCLILVDIDHFKKINDSHGHLFGDHVLRGLAKVLDSGVRQRGTVSRWGGEEFAILLEEIPVAKAHAVAETLRAAMAKINFRKSKDQENLVVTISLGMAAYRKDESMDNWIRRADLALYASKLNGRNRVTQYDETLEFRR